MNSVDNTETSRAPIALFVYNRPEHTRKTVEALAKNEGAQSSVLYIFSDSAKSSSDAVSVAEVRNYIHRINSFRQVIIIENSKNFGLAKSIITGVTSLCEKYGRVIVLEDDLVTSPHFLTFMNEALDFYEKTPKVMHVSGCCYPVEQFGADDTFFLRVPLCWGWATWQRAWLTFENDISVMNSFDIAKIKQFNFDNTYSYWEQLVLNRDGKISTWFIFWYANIYLRGGLSLFPAHSLVSNIGMDDSGTHCGKTNAYDVSLSDTNIKITAIHLAESTIGFEKHKNYFKKLRGPFILRAVKKIYILLFG